MRLARKLLKILVWIVAVILIIVIGILGFIQTPFAKRMIGEVIARVTRTSDGGEVRFGKITGLIPYHIQVGDFRIRDGEGYWLVVEDADVLVSLPDLIRFRLRALEVRVRSASILRLPRGNTTDDETAAEENDTPFTLRSLPALRCDLLSVGRASLDESVLGERIDTELKGYRIRTSPSTGGSAYIRLNRIDGRSGRLVLAAASGAEFSPLSASIMIDEDAGGSLGTLVSPGSSESFSFFFRGRGPIDKWKVNLSAKKKEELKLTGDLILDLTSPLASGKLEASLGMLPLKELAGRGTLFTSFTVVNGGQNVSARIQAEALELPFCRAGALEININAEDILRTPSGTLDLKGSDLQYSEGEKVSRGGAVLIGKISGRISLRETDRKLESELELKLVDCSFPHLPTGSLNPLELIISGRLKDNRINLSLDSGEQSRLSLKAEAEAPLDLSLHPISLHPPGDGTISGKLQARIDLELLSNYLAISRQSIRGIVSADLSASGTSERPEITGQVKIEKGRYRNLNTGTALNGVTMDLQADRDQITIKQFEATTPSHGKLGITGQMTLAPAEHFPYSLSLELEKAELTDLEELTAVFSGKILLEGTTEEGRLQGTVKIDQAEGRIPRTFPPSVPEIPVIEINQPGGATPIQKPSGPSPFLKKFALDLQIIAPDKITVKGRGLDSEWKADIKIKGTAARPLISGGINLLDGIFIFMGEDLEMKDCSVTMDGRFPPVPQLKINMEEVKSDITINLQIIGPVTAPEVILSSQPPYPTDEILARLLYGRSASQLSGIQALQIANGLRTLQGKGGFFDLLTGWTSFLGDIQVDLTELEGRTDQTAVRVRWSVTRHIYVENQRAIDDKGNVFIARWDLSRHLQLNTQSGYGLMGDSAYLRYRWDY